MKCSLVMRMICRVGVGMAKGLHQLFLCIVELIDGKFRNEGNTFTAFYIRMNVSMLPR